MTFALGLYTANMEENEPVCNFTNCHKKIRHEAWVTVCSHIFCKEHAESELAKRFACPACHTHLPNKFEILHVNLQPSEVFKSLVLAGQNPQTIMEVCRRAVCLWTYQMGQQIAHRRHVATKSKEQEEEVKKYWEHILQRTKAELSSLRANLAETRNELAETKRRYDELMRRHSERRSPPIRPILNLESATTDDMNFVFRPRGLPPSGTTQEIEEFQWSPKRTPSGETLEF